MSIFKFLLKESKIILLMAITAGIIAGVGSVGIIVHINEALGGEMIALDRFALAFSGLLLIVLISNFSSQVLMIRLSEGTVAKLRIYLSRRILYAQLRQIEELGTARLLAVLTNDILVIANAFTTIPYLCINISILIACLAYLGFLSPILLIALLGFVSIGVIIYRILMKKSLRVLGVAREKSDDLYEGFRGLTEGIKELKLYHGRSEDFLSEDIEATARSLEKLNVKGLTYYSAADTWGRLLFYLFIGLLIFLIHLLPGYDKQILIGYAVTSLYLVGPLAMILSALPELGQASISLKKIESLGLSFLQESISSLPVDQGDPSFEQIEMINVTHSYYREGDDRYFSLGPVTLEVKPAEIVFLVGGNGSGKTTLIKLLAGLYEPDSGLIRLNGKTVDNENNLRHRQLFSAVFADFYLFKKFRRLGRSKIDIEVGEYLKKLQLDRKVQVIDGELSTTELSQGQRKRLALLMAYLEDRPIYIFDEWAADQDPEFKDFFYYHILPELKSRGKAVIAITHDDRYFHMADRVIKLDYGQIQEEKRISKSDEIEERSTYRSAKLPD